MTKFKPLPDNVKMMLDIIYATYISTTSSDVPNDILQKHNLEVLSHASIRGTGYYGLAFSDAENKQIYVVHRGTDVPYIVNSIINKIKMSNITELKDSIRTLRNDLFNDTQILLENMPTQAVGASNFLTKIQKAFPEYSITSLGHSLGGALTELCYEMSNGTINSVAFDSPGASEIWRNYSTDIIAPHTNSTSALKDIKYYNAFPNAINTCLTHVNNKTGATQFFEIQTPLVHHAISTSLKYYLENTLLQHIGMVLPDNREKLTYKDSTDVWPVGLKSGLEYFYSNANVGYWTTVLEPIWNVISCRLNIPEDKKQQEQEKFINFFIRSYLDQKAEYWQYVMPINNLGEAINQYNDTPLYKKLFFIPIETSIALLASWYNYSKINNKELVKEYIESYCAPQHDVVSKIIPYLNPIKTLYKIIDTAFFLKDSKALIPVQWKGALPHDTKLVIHHHLSAPYTKMHDNNHTNLWSKHYIEETEDLPVLGVELF
jgi:hypothetical protein